MYLTQEEIQAAVKDPEWQELRRNLKGKTTREKIDTLKAYYNKSFAYSDYSDWQDKLVQIQNYLNALSRGGLIEPVRQSQSIYWQLNNVQIKR